MRDRESARWSPILLAAHVGITGTGVSEPPPIITTAPKHHASHTVRCMVIETLAIDLAKNGKARRYHRSRNYCG